MFTPANDNENLYAADDALWSCVDNPNDEYASFERAPPGDRRSINIIASDGDPVVPRNVARHYVAKSEPWSEGMMRRLNAAANANENRKVA